MNAIRRLGEIMESLYPYNEEPSQKELIDNLLEYTPYLIEAVQNIISPTFKIIVNVCDSIGKIFK